ncbi:MAG: hypothetical protein LBC98_06525 [Prevotellaceae bacterium]|nr:hypothetical protein [Prevotellaceae bacterium]
MQGARGKIGNSVSRQQDGNTIVSIYKVPYNPRTEKQQEGRGRFRKAVQYAKSALAEPKIKSLYEAAARQSKRKVYHTALSDYLTQPIVEWIDALPDSMEIRILVTNVITVMSVHIRILGHGEALSEEGEAHLDAAGTWRYTSHENLQTGNRLEIIVTDYPGNIVVCEWSC